MIHSYQPRGSMVTLMECTDPEVLIAGSAGTGKSRACLERLNLLALHYPGMRGLIVRKTQVSLTNTALVTWRRFVVAEAMAAKVISWYGGSQQEPAHYRYPNWSLITIGGLDQATRVMSSEYDVIYVQEATELTEEDWNALNSRLRNGAIPFQQLMADCNPAHPGHWLKRLCDSGRVRLLESRHEENPVLYTEDGTLTERGAAYIGRLDNLTGLAYQRLRLGLWVAAEGLIYDQYDPAVHVIDPFPIPAEWPRWWVVDFGYVHPFVCQWWAEDPDGKLYLYREWYKTGMIVRDHARKMLSLVTRHEDPDDPTSPLVWTEPKPRSIICDHDAEDRATLEDSLGLGTVPAHKTVTDGIQADARRFADRRLFIFRNATVERDQAQHAAMKPTSVTEELPGYVWDIGKGKGAKEQPVKENDDGADCVRYMCADRDLAAQPSVRYM